MGMNPLSVLREGIKQVPAVKYALGVAGVAAGLALAKAFFESTQAAVFGVAAMLVLMVLLLLFVAATAMARTHLRPLALVLTWAMLILFVASTFLFATSVFFDVPKPYPALVAPFTSSSGSLRFGEPLNSQPLN